MSTKDKIFSFYTSENSIPESAASFFAVMRGRDHYPYYGDPLNLPLIITTSGKLVNNQKVSYTSDYIAINHIKGHTTVGRDIASFVETTLLSSWIIPIEITLYAAIFLTSLLVYPYFAATMGMRDSGGVVANPASQFASSVYSLLANNPVSFLGYIAAKTINTGIVAIRTKLQEYKAKKEEALEQSDFAHSDKPELTEGKVQTISKLASSQNVAKDEPKPTANTVEEVTEQSPARLAS